MHRRHYIAMTVSLLASGVAGCIGDNDDDTADAEGSGASDLPEETQALAEKMASLVDEERNIHRWRFSGDLYILEFIGEFPPDDIPILGRAYAEVVADGFEYLSMPTAINENGAIEYMVYIEPEWANQLNEGTLTDAEYHDLVAETIHGE